MDYVQRTREPLTPPRLLEVLRGASPVNDRLPANIPLSPVAEAVNSVVGMFQGSDIDRELVEPFHRALKDLSRAEAADMRVWHWLCAVAFPDAVWKRWRTAGPPNSSELETILTDSLARRFLGSPSLVGVSRNTFARLWWTAEHLDGDYDLARRALARQDMFQAIFERLFGLYPPAARAAIRKFDGRAEDDIRRAARWLNYSAATAVLEVLDESAIEQILDQSLLTLG
jgi:hypothetical protein